MIVFRRIDGPRLPLSATVRLTTTVRKALQSLATQPPREVLSGHTLEGSPSQHPHVAVVPLPFVGHRHADGDIKGFAVVLPFGLDPFSEDRRHIARALMRLKELVMGSCGKWIVQRVTPAMAATPLPVGESLRIETYTKAATRWSTVTPMVLDGFPKHRPSKGTADLIRRACMRVGLPEPVRIEFGKVSWLRGAPVSHQFEYRYKEGLPAWPLVHAFLEFNEQVCGPILLGAGRYIGLGLCRRYPHTGTEGSDDR
jgi:CRISPR-associated protein Csb2